MVLDLIYEDEFVITINKPNNVLVHHAKHSRNVAGELSLLQLIEIILIIKFILFID